MSARSLEPSLSAWLADHHGIITRERLDALGLTAGSIRTLLETSRLVVVHTGVYLSASSLRTELQGMATLVAATGGVISHSSAGRLWNFRKLFTFRELHVTVPHSTRCGVATELGRVHQSLALPATDVVMRPDGISVTSPPRTVFDLASMCSADDLESIVEQGLDRKLFTVPTLHSVGRRLAGPGRDGSANFANVFARRDVWRRPVQSDLELRLCRALERAGIGPLVRQIPIRLPDGATIHADLAVPDRNFLIEVDHVTWHGGRLDNMYDRWRDRQCHRLGWHTEQVSDDDITRRMRATVAELVEVFRTLPLSSGPALSHNIDPLQSARAEPCG